MKRLLCFFLASLMCLTAMATESRLKDLVTVKGVRPNPVLGYGLVIGLNGTGDAGGEITNSSLKLLFQKLGLDPKREIVSKNVAAVIVTGDLPAFARQGQKVDIKVSSIGDASSLAGGTLLITPLKGGDGQIYALASGSISIGGLKQGEKFATIGLIPNGAVVEKELITDFEKKKSVRLGLNNSDFTTAARIEKTLNTELGGKYAMARDASTIDLIIPFEYQRNVVQLMALIENFKVTSDQKAKTVINERTGTIVAGGEIVLKPVAIAHGALSIEIKESDASVSGGKKKGDSLYYIDKKTTLSDLVKALNAFGTTPEDLISIFQALKHDGALVADIELL